MKKIFSLFAAALLATGVMSATDASELRIYLNAGHGSWGPNDRPMATISYPLLASTGRPDTCGFYESNTNLWKVLKLGSKLVECGFTKDNIMYSRVKNGPYPYVSGAEDEYLYNRNLSEICEEVEANNMDVFLSVHSNASTDGSSANYPLFLYRGTDGSGGDLVSGSRDMAAAMWPIFYTNGIDVTSYYSQTSSNLRGDISFYGSSSTRTDPNTGNQYTAYLGVLKHGAMGFLSEGYFHTYQPARHRALNSDYCGQEGVRYARGMVSYFGGTAETTGYIMGTVKDLHEKISNSLFSYSANSIDQWLPINGAVVTLYKAGEKIAEYTVDNNYNGVFVFEGLTPGSDYTLDATADGYKELADEYKEAITVTANETTYPLLYLEATDYVEDETVYYNYPDPDQPEYLTGVPAAFNFGQTASTAYQTVADAVTTAGGSITRTLTYGDSTIVLATSSANEPTIYLIDNVGQTYTTLSTSGVPDYDTTNDPGYYSKISDIAITADGKLIACNYTHNQYSSTSVEDGYQRGTFRAYLWSTFDADPTAWFTSTSSANFSYGNAGKALAVSGPSDDCTVLTTCTNGNLDTTIYRSMRLIAFTVVDDALAATTYYNGTTAQGSTNYAEDLIGETYQLTVSPYDDNNFIIDGPLCSPFEFSLPSSQREDCPVVAQMSDDALGVAPIGMKIFKYAQHILMSAPYADDEGAIAGVKLLDITDGLASATEITTTGTSLTTADDATISYAGAVVDQEDITIYFTGKNGITMTTDGTDQPTYRGEFAYDLGMTADDTASTLTYNVTGDAPAATLILTSVEDGTTTVEYDLGAVTAGANTYTLDATELGEGNTYTWAIQVESYPVVLAQRIYASDALATTSVRGGVAFVRDTESDAFGKIVVANGKSQGFDIYTPTFTKEGNYFSDQFYASNASSPLRVTEEGGRIYANDWSDAHAGIWVFDPANPTSIWQLFGGEWQSGGSYALDGTVIGGGGTTCKFIGSGSSRQMYHFAEDYPSANSGNIIVRYDIGEDTIITKEPAATFSTASAYLANTNVELIPLENGFFASQVRSSGNNTKSVPGFIYCDLEGNILFNSGSDMTDLTACGSGIAINDEGTLFAVSEGTEGILVCGLSWEDSVPVFDPLYHIPDSDFGSDMYQLDFDIAGNLYAYSKDKGFNAYAVPNDAPVALTEAKTALVITGATDESGIESATRDTADALKIYPNPATDAVTVVAGEQINNIAIYNLAGALIATPTSVSGTSATVSVSDLPAGAYIVRVNGIATRLIKK